MAKIKLKKDAISKEQIVDIKNTYITRMTKTIIPQICRNTNDEEFSELIMAIILRGLLESKKITTSGTAVKAEVLEQYMSFLKQNLRTIRGTVADLLSKDDVIVDLLNKTFTVIEKKEEKTKD